MVNICEYGGYLGHQKEFGDGSLSSQGVNRVNDIFSWNSARLSRDSRDSRDEIVCQEQLLHDLTQEVSEVQTVIFAYLFAVAHFPWFKVVS